MIVSEIVYTSIPFIVFFPEMNVACRSLVQSIVVRTSGLINPESIFPSVKRCFKVEIKNRVMSVLIVSNWPENNEKRPQSTLFAYRIVIDCKMHERRRLTFESIPQNLAYVYPYIG